MLHSGWTSGLLAIGVWRRQRCVLFVFTLASVGCFTSLAVDAENPNIILVMTDDQGYAPVGRHGHPWIRTPNLDRFYDESTRLTRFLVSPTCSPTRAALLTGRHPMRNGITHTILERERMALNAKILPQVLGAVGYHSGIFGKWHLGDEEPYQPHRRGFDEAFIHGAGGIGQQYDCSCADVPGNKYFDPIVRHNGVFKRTEGFCTDVFFDAALDWINTQRQTDDPFFAYIVTNAPHGPFIAPPENEQRFSDLGFAKRNAGFYGMIENIDENFGRLNEKLGQWGLAKNTLVIFLSDNGMTGGGSNNRGGMLADGYPFYNAHMKGLKGSVDEGGVRVPAFFRWPGKIAANRDIQAVTAHIDLFPTLVELVGAETPRKQVDGRSFLKMLTGQEQAWPVRYLVTHCGRWPKGEDPNRYQWENFAIRSQRFRLVGKTQLYDMIADPGQTRNVIDQYPDKVKMMLAFYDHWWKQTVPLMVNEQSPNSKVQPFPVKYNQQLQRTGIPLWKPQYNKSPIQ